MSTENRIIALFERMANSPEDIHKNADVFDLFSNAIELIPDCYSSDPEFFMKVFAPENLSVLPLWALFDVVHYYEAIGIWDFIRKSNKDQILRNIQRLGDRKKAIENSWALKTGYEELDLWMGGFKNGSLYLLGGRPSMGKTAFAVNLVNYIAIKSHVPTIWFSLEQSAGALTERLINLRAKMRAGSGKVKTIHPLSGVPTTSKNPLWIIDTPAISTSKIAEQCRMLQKQDQFTAGFAVVDYFQLLGPEAEDNGSLPSVRDDLLKDLKQIAEELNCPVLVLSQLQRTCEERKDHRPELRDLPFDRDVCGVFDGVLLLYREEYYNSSAGNSELTEVNVYRNHLRESKIIRMRWIPESGAFVSIDRPWPEFR